jgi:UDP-N-acetylmuramate dehydrogenase
LNQERLTTQQARQLEGIFDEDLKRDVPLAPFTSARMGGSADYLVEIQSAQSLEVAVRALWKAHIPFRILGGGSNVLVADAGVRELILLNKARARRFIEDPARPQIWAESGAMLGTLARLAAERGWTGLEWAAGVPGTLGGAIVGNAGAHGRDMSHSVLLADILQQGGQALQWSCEELGFSYRTSRIKQASEQFVVLSVTLELENATADACKEKMREFLAHRVKTQPPGASMGSMFKNPEGDFAGRLIEEAGLKGYGLGAVEISDKHANFFLNKGDGRAEDVWKLICKARDEVKRKFGITLELEVEMIGAWPENAMIELREKNGI